MVLHRPASEVFLTWRQRWQRCMDLFCWESLDFCVRSAKGTDQNNQCPVADRNAIRTWPYVEYRPTLCEDALPSRDWLFI